MWNFLYLPEFQKHQRGGGNSTQQRTTGFSWGRAQQCGQHVSPAPSALRKEGPGLHPHAGLPGSGASADGDPQEDFWNLPSATREKSRCSDLHCAGSSLKAENIVCDGLMRRVSWVASSEWIRGEWSRRKPGLRVTTATAGHEWRHCLSCCLPTKMLPHRINVQPLKASPSKRQRSAAC